MPGRACRRQSHDLHPLSDASLTGPRYSRTPGWRHGYRFGRGLRGHGGLLRAIAAWGQRRGLKVRLSGIDVNARSTVVAREATPRWMDIDYRTADVFSYALAGRPDFIVSSHFTHHLSDDDVVKFLTWLDENSGYGWYLVDLHRHALPYYGFPALARLMGWHRIVREAGVIFIARSFRRSDWRKYLDRAGQRADISWHLFRFCVSRTQPKTVKC